MIRIPITSCVPTTYPISDIREETEHVKTFTFEVTFGAKPGQFLMIWLPGVDEVPMSVAMDDGRHIKVTFFDVGDMTKTLFTRNVGDLIGLRGPFGTHYSWKKDQHLILVAGGYGAAPMYFVAQEAVKDGCTIDFVVGARGAEHLLYLEEIEGLENTTLHIATDDGSKGHKGYNTKVLEKLLNDLTAPVFAQSASTGKHVSQLISVYACGPEMMMKRISDICFEKDVDCFMSLERWMKCGYGLCGNCVVDPLGIRLCTNGPVVHNDVIRQMDDFGVYHRDALGKKHFFAR